MEKYVKPELDIVMFEAEDIIVTSGLSDIPLDKNELPVIKP